MKDLPQLIRAAREQKKLSQESLADGLKIPQSVLSAWENGRRIPGLHHLLQLAIFFKEDEALLKGIYETVKTENNKHLLEIDGITEADIENLRQRMMALVSKK